MIVSHNSDDDIVLHTIDGYIDLHNSRLRLTCYASAISMYVFRL